MPNAMLFWGAAGLLAGLTAWALAPMRPKAPTPPDAPAQARAERTGQWIGRVAAPVAPALALILYSALGRPDLVGTPAAQSGPQGVPENIEILAKRAAVAAGDPLAQAELARALATTGQLQEALHIYERALRLAPNDAQLLADYADAAAMTQGRQFAGLPEQLIARALELSPAQPKALALAASAAYQRGNDDVAIAHWTRVLAAVPPESPFAASVRASIDQARLRLAGRTAPAAAAGPAAGPVGISGVIKLSPALASKAEPNQTVFIYVRQASGGPGRPLAVQRRLVKELPITFFFEDTATLSPGTRLSDQGPIVVGARVSRNGSATPQAGDLEGLSAPILIGDSGLVLVIDHER